ncbi:MAG: hypothetical protein ABI589_05575 [Burkholderiales bacterium]
MKTNFSVRLRRTLVATIALTSIGVGAIAATQAQIPEVAVKERASQRWQALIAGKYEDAYKLLAPGMRAIQSYMAYSNGIGAGAAWTAADVIRVECNDKQDNCTATIRVDSKALFPGMSMSKPQTISTHLEETWIKQEGNWWFFPKS